MLNETLKKILVILTAVLALSLTQLLAVIVSEVHTLNTFNLQKPMNTLRHQNLYS